MSIEADLRTTLSPVLGDAVYPDLAPQQQPVPYATWQMVGGDAAEWLEGGAAPARNARVQVNVWAATRQQANDLMRAVDDALRVGLKASPLGAFIARTETAVSPPLYGAQQDFSLWY